MGMINVNSFRSAVQSQNPDDILTFDANRAKVDVKAGSGAVLRDFEVVQSESDKQRNCEVRGLLLNALSREIHATGRADSEQMKAFLESMSMRLLGDGKTGSDAVCFKPLSARDVRAILDEKDRIDAEMDNRLIAANTALRTGNKALCVCANTCMHELEVAAKKGDVEAGRMLEKFASTISRTFKNIECGNAGVAELKKAYETFTAEAGCARLGKLIAEYGPKFDEKATAFLDAWNGSVGGDPEVFDKVRDGVLDKMTEFKNRFLGDLAGLRDNVDPNAADLARLQKDTAGMKADFEKALAAFAADGRHAIDQTLGQKAPVQRQYDHLLQATEDFERRVSDLETRLAAEAGKGVPGAAEKKAELAKWKNATLASIRSTVDAQIRSAGGAVSADTFQDAARSIRALAEKFEKTFAGATGQPTAFARTLERLPAPDIRIRSQDRALADARLMAFGREIGIGEELSLMDSPAAGEIKTDFAAFKSQAGELLARLRASGNLDAANRFADAMSASADKLEKACLAALKSGIDLSDGVGTVFANAYKDLKRLYAESMTATLKNTLSVEAEHILRELGDACDDTDSASPKGALYNAGWEKFDAIRSAAETSLDALVEKGQVPSEASVKAFLDEFRSAVSAYMKSVAQPDTGIRSAITGILKKAGFGGDAEGSVVPEIRAVIDAETSVVDKLSGMGGGVYADADALAAAAEREVRFNQAFGSVMPAFEKSVRAQVVDAMMNHAAADTYFERDEVDGHVKGLNVKGQALLEEILPGITAALVKYLHEVDIPESPVSLDQVKALAAAESKSVIPRRLRTKMVLPPPVEEKPQTRYPVGNQFFGFDLKAYLDLDDDGINALSFTDIHKIENPKVRSFMWLVYSLLTPRARERAAAGTLKPADVIGDRMGNGYIDGMSNDFREQLWAGKFRLEDVNASFRVVMTLYLRGEPTQAQFASAGGSGFMTKDIGAIVRNLSVCGLTPPYFASLPDEKIDTLCDLLGAMYQLNYNRAEDLNAVCLRVCGQTIQSAVGMYPSHSHSVYTEALKRCEHGGEADDTGGIIPRPSQEERTLVETWEPLLALTGQVLSHDKYWRSLHDPLALVKDDERRAVSFVSAQFIPDDKDKKDVLAARKALVALQPGQKTTVTFGGVPIEFTRDEAHGLSATVKLVKSHLENVKDKKGDGYHVEIIHGSESTRRPVSIAVGGDHTSFLDMLDDVIANAPDTYGAQAVSEVLTKAVATDPTSSRTRQLAMNILSGAAHLRTADLCSFATVDLAAFARDLLANPEFKGLSPEKRAALLKPAMDAKTSGTVMLNAAGTLELYDRMTAANPQEVDKCVFVPTQKGRKKGESVQQAYIRQVHEFASDLILPNDTTGYDCFRRAEAGKVPPPSDAEIDLAVMRNTLNKHRAVVEMLISHPEYLDSLDLPVGDGQTLPGFKKALKSLIGTLTSEYEKKDWASFGDFMNAVGTGLVDGALKTARTALTESSNAALETLQTSFAAKLTQSFKANMGSTDRKLWQKSIDELANSSKINVDKGYGKFLMTVIGGYFAQMDPLDKSRMASLVVRYSTSDSSTGEALGALLKGAGPILQKLMQGLPQSTLPEDLRQAVADLKCNLAPIPEETVRAYLFDMVQTSGGRITHIDVVKSLGAASVGQAFLCRLVTPENPVGEECVVKILRPDVQSRAKREEAFFNAQAEKLGLGSMLKTRFDGIFEELDLMVEAHNIVEGSVYDPGTSLYSEAMVSSMKLYSKTNSTMNTLVLRKASGDTYDNYGHDVAKRKDAALSKLEKVANPDGSVSYRTTSALEYVAAKNRLAHLRTEISERQANLRTFITKWAYEAFFGGGFFHGDLHAGNVMTAKTGLTVIDYGNVSHFTSAQQTELLRMLGWASGKNAGRFLDHLQGTLSPSGLSAFKSMRPAIDAEIGEIFSKTTVDETGKAFVAALQHLQNAGVELPGALFNLMQSMQRLEESVNQLTREYDEIDAAIESLSIVAPGPEDKPVHFLDAYLGKMTPAVIKSITGNNTTEAKFALQRYFTNVLNGTHPPTSDEKIRQALLNEFTDPKSFREIVERYRNTLAHYGRTFDPAFEQKLGALDTEAICIDWSWYGKLQTKLAAQQSIIDNPASTPEQVEKARKEIEKTRTKEAATLAIPPEQVEEARRQQEAIADEFVAAIKDVYSGEAIVANDILKEIEKGPEAFDKIAARLLDPFTGIETGPVPPDTVLRECLSNIDREALFKPENGDLRKEASLKIADALIKSFIGFGEAGNYTEQTTRRDDGTGTFAGALGNAISDGKSKLTGAFIGINPLLVKEGNDLRNAMKKETKVLVVAEERAKSVDARLKPLTTAPAPDQPPPISNREAEIASGYGAGFVMSKEVGAFLRDANWADDPAKRGQVVEMLRYNLAGLKAEMIKHGLGDAMNADPTKFATYAKAAAIAFFARHVECETSFRGTQIAKLAGEVGADADLRAFLDALGAQAPIVVETERLHKEVDDLFALF